MLKYRRKCNTVCDVSGIFGSTIFSGSCYYVCDFLDETLAEDKSSAGLLFVLY